MFPRLFCGLAMMLVYSGAWCAVLQDNGDGTVMDLTAGRTWQQVDDDTKRNWTEKTSFEKGKKVSLEKRTISYY